MDLIEPMCRICRRQSDHLESLQGIRDGMPISVLVMMICPIKIFAKETFLPNFICEECLEVLLAAHKLRDESLVSDRYFRDCYESENLLEEEEDYSEVKREAEALSSSLFMPATARQTYTDQWKKPRKQESQPVNSNDDFNYEVDCFKKGANKSSAWEYFGRLVDSNGDLVESETGFFFCRLCVSEKKTIKNRYKSGNISTGMIFTHLKVAHGIVMGSRTSPPPTAKPIDDSQNPQITRQMFTCPEENCGKEFVMKMCLDIHLGLEHTGRADEPPINTEFLVDLSQKETRATSMAWNYFGFLLDSNHVLVDEDHYYCKLCVGMGNLAKYNKSCSTTTLFQHLRTQHLNNTRKRKRFCISDENE